MSIRIGMLLDVDFPPDDRPEKQAQSLITAGFEVFLLCFTSTGQPLNEKYKGIYLTRFHQSEFLHNKLSAAYMILPFHRWIWGYHIKKFVKNNRIDILHVHDLPLSDIAYKTAKKYNLKLVLDQHEYWSNWIGNTYHYNTAIGKIVNKFSKWKKYERKYLHRADLTITVSERLRQLYIRDVGLIPEKVITVPNTPSREIFNEKNIDNEIIKKYADKFTIFYAGAIDILRGIDLIVKAMGKLKGKIPNLNFVLAGRFARGSNIFELAESLGIKDQLEYVGWLEVNQLPSYITASKLCVYTPHSATSDEINNTIHTKLYQYAAMKKPIIISNAKMMRDFVINNDLGISIDEQSADLLAEKILYIHKNYEEVKKNVDKNAIKLITNGEIFWDQTIKQLIKYYQANFIPPTKTN